MITTRLDNILYIWDTKLINGELRQDSKEYQDLLASTIKSLVDLKNHVLNTLALFSDNETLDDLATNNIKFLALDFHLAQMCSRKQLVNQNKSIDSNNKQAIDQRPNQKMKLLFLKKSIQLYIQFLITLQDYKILDKFLSSKLDSFQETFNPTLNDLYSQPKSEKDLNGAYSKRQQKIEMYQSTKKIDTELKQLQDLYREKTHSKNDDKDANDQIDNMEETLRNLSILKLKSMSYRAFNEIEQLLYEVELLQNFINHPIEELDTHNNNNSSSGNKINTIDKSSKFDKITGYTHKLESLNKPLLSKKGKILRNFTLIDNKKALRDKVRGYGQYGPTMSVEEFLEQEWESGRVLQGGENDIDEDPDKPTDPSMIDDDNDWNDKQTYKARQWDDFTESHAKGSGNTLNNG